MSDPVTHAIDEQVNFKRIEEVDDCLTPTDQLLMSIAISLKRIADAFDQESVKGSVLYWLESIAHSATAGRS